MTIDPETLATYSRMAGDYADRISRSEPDRDLQSFMTALPQNEGPVLDWGSGPGNSAAIMGAHNIRVEATDACPEMATLARELGITVRVEPFEALEAEAIYRGIWANFSLMHAPHAAMEDLLARAAAALLPGGILQLGMKTGEGSVRDAIGRLTFYWNEGPLSEVVGAVGLETVSVRYGESTGLHGRRDPFMIHLSRKAV